jgi:hypothetical protein
MAAIVGTGASKKSADARDRESDAAKIARDEKLSAIDDRQI